MVAWLVRALFSDSVEGYVLAIRGLNPILVWCINRSVEETLSQFELQDTWQPAVYNTRLSIIIQLTTTSQ